MLVEALEHVGEIGVRTVETRMSHEQSRDEW